MLLLPLPPDAGPRLAAVLRYIHQHLDQPLPVAQLCALACMSRATFFRFFKRRVGLTPVEYIVRQRLAVAKRLLRQPPGAAVADVCLRAGFNNLSYFQALFKRHEGLTPGAYRRAAGAGA